MGQIFNTHEMLMSLKAQPSSVKSTSPLHNCNGALVPQLPKGEPPIVLASNIPLTHRHVISHGLPPRASPPRQPVRQAASPMRSGLIVMGHGVETVDGSLLIASLPSRASLFGAASTVKAHDVRSSTGSLPAAAAAGMAAAIGRRSKSLHRPPIVGRPVSQPAPTARPPLLWAAIKPEAAAARGANFHASSAAKRASEPVVVLPSLARRLASAAKFADPVNGRYGDGSGSSAGSGAGSPMTPGTPRSNNLEVRMCGVVCAILLPGVAGTACASWLFTEAVRCAVYVRQYCTASWCLHSLVTSFF